MGYPEPNKRGRYLAYWLAFRNAGSILGGAINLGLNVKNSKGGSVSSSTYLVFIVLQAIAPFVGCLLSSKFRRSELGDPSSPKSHDHAHALVLVIDPSQIRRPDSTPVRMEKKRPFREEMKELFRVASRREVLLL